MDPIGSKRITYAVVTTVLLIGASSPLQAQTGSIEGTVTTGELGADDADVTVQSLGRRVRADGAGRFSFDRVPPGDYIVEADSPRWGRAVQVVSVRSDETTEVTLELDAVFHLDEVVVSAGPGPIRRSEAYQAASVVTSRDLVARGEASLGETLARQPGVSSTFFGPGASRPLIRGVGGDRIRVLEDGIGVGDASTTSPDHAVALESRSADRIEVIRGPATLLYGSSAVGGIVNVLDSRIASEPPTQTLSGFVEGLAGSVADERTGSATVTARTGAVVLSASGLWRDASDYTIPGFAPNDPPPGAQPAAGIVENSAIEGRRGSVAATLIGERGYIGTALSVQRSDYGVPGGEEGITIDLDQNRMDIAGALRFGPGVVRNLTAKLGIADYRHLELEGTEIGTRFFNDYVEGRLEGEHGFGERVHGVVGAQLSWRDFEAVGEEAFVPPSRTRSMAFFAYEEIRASQSLSVQAGARVERQTAEVDVRGIDRTDTGVSGSLGLNWRVSDILTLAASTSRSVKHPNAEELFSNGPHAATRAFEIGDPSLELETALGLDVTAHLHGDRFRGSGSLFITSFSDYIYESATGGERDGLAEFVFTQGEARFTGFELEGELDVLEGDPSAGRPHLSLQVLADATRATLTTTDEPLPRIPALRIGGGAAYRQGPFWVRFSARRTTAQDRVASLETPTEGFTMVDASISYRIFTGRLFHDVTLVGTNLTDAEARLHTSFLKDVAPLPGRGVRLVYRLTF